MNKDDINGLMNCQCLQGIIQNDMSRHTFEDKDDCNRGFREPKLFHRQTAEDRSHVLQATCLTFYRDERFEKGRAYIDRVDKEYSNIPFLYCPICGTKTKHNIPEESFYHQFQNEQS
jgi:hypothetical protein